MLLLGIAGLFGSLWAWTSISVILALGVEVLTLGAMLGCVGLIVKKENSIRSREFKEQVINEQLGELSSHPYAQYLKEKIL